MTAVLDNVVRKVEQMKKAEQSKAEHNLARLITLVEDMKSTDPVMRALLKLASMTATDPAYLPVLSLLGESDTAVEDTIKLLGGTVPGTTPGAPAAIEANKFGPDVQTPLLGGERIVLLPHVDKDGNTIPGAHKEAGAASKQGYDILVKEGILYGYWNETAPAAPTAPTPTDDQVLPVHSKGKFGFGGKPTGVTMKHSEAKDSDTHEVVYHQKTGQPIKVVPKSGFDNS